MQNATVVKPIVGGIFAGTVSRVLQGGWIELPKLESPLRFTCTTELDMRPLSSREPDTRMASHNLCGSEVYSN